MGLFTTGTPTAKFTAIGDSVVGRIVDIGQQQRTEVIYDPATKTYKSGGPMFWSGGRPVADAATDPRNGQPNQPVMDGFVVLDTGVADENGETRKKVIVKGKNELAAVRQACTDAGVRDVEVGGMLKKIWVSGAGGLADPRVYQYLYKPPAAEAAAQEANPAVGEAADRLKRAHAASPILSQMRSAGTGGFADEPPF